MTEIHHATAKAADMDLAKKTISPESHAAIMENRLSLAEARELGRERGPYGEPVGSRNSKSDRSRPCLACGKTVPTGNRFHQGCDMKMHRLATEYVRGQRELTEEQLTYVEESGKLDRARQRVVEEDEKAAYKEDKRRERKAEKSE